MAHKWVYFCKSLVFVLVNSAASAPTTDSVQSSNLRRGCVWCLCLSGIPPLLSGKMAADTDHHQLFISGMWQRRQSGPFSMEPSNAAAALRGFPASPPKRVAMIVFHTWRGELCSAQEGRWSVVRGGGSGDDLRLFWEPVLVPLPWLEHVLHSVVTQCLALITGSNFQCSFDLIAIQLLTINIISQQRHSAS